MMATWAGGWLVDYSVCYTVARDGRRLPWLRGFCVRQSLKKEKDSFRNSFNYGCCVVSSTFLFFFKRAAENLFLYFSFEKSEIIFSFSSFLL